MQDEENYETDEEEDMFDRDPSFDSKKIMDSKYKFGFKKQNK